MTYLSILSKNEMSKRKFEQNCQCWNCMTENHVKEGPSVPIKPMNVKVAFLSLIKKDQNKNKVEILKAMPGGANKDKWIG